MQDLENRLIGLMVEQKLVYLSAKDIEGHKITITKNLKHGSFSVKREQKEDVVYDG